MFGMGNGDSASFWMCSEETGLERKAAVVGENASDEDF